MNDIYRGRQLQCNKQKQNTSMRWQKWRRANSSYYYTFWTIFKCAKCSAIEDGAAHWLGNTAVQVGTESMADCSNGLPNLSKFSELRIYKCFYNCAIHYIKKYFCLQILLLSVALPPILFLGHCIWFLKHKSICTHPCFVARQQYKLIVQREYHALTRR